MKRNRLHLNFEIEMARDRVAFLYDYLQDDIFKEEEPTNAELLTMANYILWGKAEETDTDYDIELESKWNNKARTESYEALLESPTFNESVLTNTTQYKYKTEKFNREEARKQAPPSILKELERIWYEIDKAELLTNYYEIDVSGTREKPPRTELAMRFTGDEQLMLRHQANQMTQRNYLLTRHRLLDLRREQYPIRDSYAPVLLPASEQPYAAAASYDMGDSIGVLPLGLVSKGELNKKIFSLAPEPHDFSYKDLEEVSKLIWTKDKADVSFDFRDTNHVYQLLALLDEIRDIEYDVESTMPQFIDTLLFYMEFADLTDLMKDILTMKIDKRINRDIANYVNEKYGKNYGENYISTIFKQKIVKEIASAATNHYEVIQNIFFPENFKRCKDCGRLLLINDVNFVRKATGIGGFSTRCKKCEKKKRDMKKNER